MEKCSIRKKTAEWKGRAAGGMKKILAAMGAAPLMWAQLSPPAAYAASGGANVITTSLNSFYSIVAALVSGVGAIILLWGVFEWGTSMQSNDGTMQANAFKRVGGGLVMILAPQIVVGFIG